VDGAVRRIDSAYDTLGRLTTVTARNGVTATSTAVNQVTRAYNGFGQLTSEWQAHTGLVSTATTPRVQYAYSQALGGNHSRLTRTTYPSGYAVDYAYAAGIDSAVSRPTSLSGQRANTTTPVTLEAFRYLGSGTVIERSRPEVNVTLSMVNFSGATADAGDKYTGLDRFGRVADQRWTQGTTATSAVVDRYGYTYDRNSNRLTRTNALAAAFSETYAYDALNQVQSFRRGNTPTPTTSQQWQFDALGNWTSVTTNGNTVTRTANAQNEYTHNGTGTFGYTPTGNLATNPQGRVFAYDAWNRLVSVREPDGTLVARYEYDGLGRRIVAQAGTASVPVAATAPVRDLYYSQGWQVLEERVRTSTGAIPATADTRFIWSPVYVDAMIARDRNADNNATTGTGGLEERVYAIQDANWNTTAIIAATGVPGVAAGAVISRFVYTPYGNHQTLTPSWTTPPTGSNSAVPWSRLFQGLEFTDATRLTHARHRDYSMNLGRFVQRDPIGFAAGDNNMYRFVGNGPTGAVDPSGLAEGYNSINQWLTGPVPQLSQADMEELDRAWRHRAEGGSAPEVTIVPGVYGDSIHLNDQYFIARNQPIPVAVCHGMSAGGRVGPVNSFKFSAGPAQLQYYQSWRDTTGASVEAAGEILTSVAFLPAAAAKNAAPRSAAKYLFDVRAGRYRDMTTGRFVAARDLPWPSDAGFASSTRQSVRPGTILDRYGKPSGRILGEPGASISARGMAPGCENMPYTRYRVLKQFDAQVGPAARVPGFGATGGATQYAPGKTVQWLIDNGFIQVIR
jgi:RHS repeat-associated protein